METPFAARMGRLGTESAFDVFRRAGELEAEGRKVIHLHAGEPDFDTPPHIAEAAHRAIEEGWTRYTLPPGIAELREAVSSFFQRTRGVDIPPDRIVVTPGAKPIMFFTILALCDEGDEVVYPDPGFPMYASIAAFAGATPVPVPLREERAFRVDPEELASLVTDRTRLIILNSPHNPCGSVLEAGDLERIAAVAEERNLHVLTDEVYWAIRYEGEHASIASLIPDRTILLDGCSKAFAMTGWRLGFGAFPEALVEPISRLVINSVSCTAGFVQKAAVAALTGPWEPVARMVEEFRRRRDLIVEGLNRIPGISCLEPAGAFYAFPNVEPLGLPAADLASHLLEVAGVACVAGTAFGAQGEGHIRFSYAASTEAIGEALEAIGAALQSLPRR